MTPLRLAARLARREVVRRPWRTVLVALLVAVPVAGMTMAAVVVRTAGRTSTDRFALEYGGADLAVFGDGGALPVGAFPPGTETVVYREDWSRARTTDDRRFRGVVTDLPLANPIAARIVRVVDGRRPSAPGEMLISPSAARKLDVSVGDTVTFERPAPATLTVTGIGERRSDLGEPMLVVAGAADWPRWNESAVAQLVDLPDSMSDAEVMAFAGGLAQQGVGMSAAVWEGYGNNAETGVRWSWVIGAVVLTVFGIVIASAFAAGARRQLATLGQLAANGASPRVLRQVLFLQGTWTGVIGSALGVVLGGIGLVALAPHIDRLVNSDVGSWELAPTDLVPIVGLGVAAATLAALVPARTTSRVPVLAALAGRRPLGRVPRRVTTAGLATSAGGLALLGLAVLGSNGGNSQVWAFTAIVGGIAILLGACTVTPRYVSVLEPIAARVGGSWRLAARSLARHRTRTAAVVSGVCAAAALAVTASSLVLTIDADNDRNGFQTRDDLVVVSTSTWRDVAPAAPRTVGPVEALPVVSAPAATLIDELRAILPDAEIVRVRAVDATDLGWPRLTGPGSTFDPAQSPGDAMEFDGRLDSIAIGDDETLDLYGLGDDERRALRDTGAVVLGAGTGTADITISRLAGSAVELDATLIDRDRQSPALPMLVVTPERAAGLGLGITAGPVAFDLPRALTGDQRERVDEAIEISREDTEFAAAGAGTPNFRYVDADFSRPSDGPSPLLLEALLSAGALLFTLFVVAVSLALAAAETRDERDVLAVVGAPPSVMRRASSRKAVLMAALGAALAVPVGFLPVVVFAMALDADNSVPLVFPWRTVFLLAIVVPLVAGIVTSVGSALSIRLRPVRMSSMAFE